MITNLDEIINIAGVKELLKFFSQEFFRLIATLSVKPKSKF